MRSLATLQLISILSLSVQSYALPAAIADLIPSSSILSSRHYNHLQRRQSTTSTQDFQISKGPKLAGIVTHPEPSSQQIILSDPSHRSRQEPELLPLTNAYTRGNLNPSTYDLLDNFLVSHSDVLSYFYTLSITGLGTNDAPDGVWEFYLRVDLAIRELDDARDQDKLPQLTMSYRQPHPTDEGAVIFGDVLGVYQLSEKDILETIIDTHVDGESREIKPARGVLKFLSSRVSRMWAFQHKHVGAEEFEVVMGRSAKDPRNFL